MKYLPNLVSDIDEKKIDHNTYEILQIKKKLTVSAEVDLYVPGL